MTIERIPVERLVKGDTVCAVENGPIGVVTDVGSDRKEYTKWTIVEYPSRLGRHTPRTCVPYKHGQDRLILVPCKGTLNG